MPINKQSILSVYDDKLTLVQWLKKVEDALKNDTLKNVELLQDGNKVAFKFVFEDSEIITDYLELQANGIKAINYDRDTLQIVITLTDGTIRVLGPLFDTQSNISVQDLNAEQVNADNIAVDGDVNCNGSINASDEVKSDDITARNTISSMERIIDNDGNFRFVEGSINLPENIQQDISKKYGKWSLSGTHLMLVFAVDLANDAQLINGNYFGEAVVPQWLFEKIIPIRGTSLVDAKNILAFADNWSTQNLFILLEKAPNNTIKFRFGGNYTLTADRTARCTFDILIDAE